MNNILLTLGVKKASTSFDEICRSLLIIALVIAMIWHIYDEQQDDISLSHIEHIIKPGTIMHESICEMDNDTQKKYVKSLKETIDADDPSTLYKYTKNISTSLAAGVLSEYAVNGNLAKPLGVVTKTIIYSCLSVLIS